MHPSCHGASSNGVERVPQPRLTIRHVRRINPRFRGQLVTAPFATNKAEAYGGLQLTLQAGKLRRMTRTRKPLCGREHPGAKTLCQRVEQYGWDILIGRYIRVTIAHDIYDARTVDSAHYLIPPGEPANLMHRLFKVCVCRCNLSWINHLPTERGMHMWNVCHQQCAPGR